MDPLTYGTFPTAVTRIAETCGDGESAAAGENVLNVHADRGDLENSRGNKINLSAGPPVVQSCSDRSTIQALCATIFWGGGEMSGKC
jgi:hypothetical protein